MVRALASHRCGPGSIFRSGVICGLSLLVLYSTPRGFLRVLRFPLFLKKTSISLSLDLCSLLISVTHSVLGAPMNFTGLTKDCELHYKAVWQSPP